MIRGKFPETIPDQIDNKLNFPLGEGKIPTNILKEDDWDVNSFPNLNPCGINGLHQKREIKGPIDQQYFDQRLKNEDTKYEQSPPYVFAAAAYIKEKQLKRKIGISSSKGNKTIGKNGERWMDLQYWTI